jgi:hypothetical protein
MIWATFEQWNDGTYFGTICTARKTKYFTGMDKFDTLAKTEDYILGVLAGTIKP